MSLPVSIVPAATVYVCPGQGRLLSRLSGCSSIDRQGWEQEEEGVGCITVDWYTASRGGFWFSWFIVVGWWFLFLVFGLVVLVCFVGSGFFSPFVSLPNSA